MVPCQVLENSYNSYHKKLEKVKILQIITTSTTSSAGILKNLSLKKLYIYIIHMTLIFWQTIYKNLEATSSNFCRFEIWPNMFNNLIEKFNLLNARITKKSFTMENFEKFFAEIFNKITLVYPQIQKLKNI